MREATDVTRRAVAAFHLTMFLEDLVASIRGTRRLARQREADGNPDEVAS